MNLKLLTHKFTFDKGLNLLQRASSSDKIRMITAAVSNRAINEGLYDSLKLTVPQKADLAQTFLSENIFDTGGNQLISIANSSLAWDYRNMLQNARTKLKDESGVATGQLTEYNLYAKTGKRSRKITEKTDASGNLTEIQEALYLGNLEYRSTWIGSNLSYDGETVKENNTTQSPQEAYIALRIRQGHKTVSEKRVYTFKDGSLVSETDSFFSLDKNIDSCELQFNDNGNLESYYATKPYGETAVSYGKVKQHPYKYSGQEKDQSGLYYYGYRNLLPQNFRWISADPSGVYGSGLNWYVMVHGNPITIRDKWGLTQGEEKDADYQQLNAELREESQQSLISAPVAVNNTLLLTSREEQKQAESFPTNNLPQTGLRQRRTTAAVSSTTNPPSTFDDGLEVVARRSQRDTITGKVPISLNCAKYCASYAIRLKIYERGKGLADPGKTWTALGRPEALGWSPDDALSKDYGEGAVKEIDTKSHSQWDKLYNENTYIVAGGNGVGNAACYIGHAVLVTRIQKPTPKSWIITKVDYYDPLTGKIHKNQDFEPFRKKVRVAFAITDTTIDKFLNKHEKNLFESRNSASSTWHFTKDVAISTVKIPVHIANGGLDLLKSCFNYCSRNISGRR